MLDQTFAYDNLDRLTGSQSATTSLGFAYDVNGNRTQASVGSNSYANVISPGSNRLLSTTGPAPARNNVHDAAGNLVSDGTASYTYSDRSRLQRAVKAGLTTEYLYNGIGQRVSKTGAAVPTGANYFVYDEQGHVLGEYSATGAALQGTVYLGDTPVVVLGNGVSYVYADHLDTPRLIARSSDGAIVWRWDTADPFGVALPQENPSGLGIFTYNLRFPGQLFDKETNNHYNYFRDYDPQTGRYVQSDPIGLGGGVNTYGYVAGNPISFVDPTGELAMLIPVAITVGRIGWTAYRAYKVAKIVSTAAASATSTGDDQCNPCKQYPSRTEAYLQANSSAGVGPDWTPVGWDQYNKPTGKADQIKYADFRSRIGSSPYGYRSPDGGEIVEHPADSDHKCPHSCKEQLRLVWRGISL